MHSNQQKRKEVILAARSYLGCPFRHQGRNAIEGFDCAGLICRVADDLSYVLMSHSNYPRHPKRGELYSAAKAAGLHEIQMQNNENQNNRQQVGDIILFHIGRRVEHMAIFTGQTLIHADEKNGKVVEHIYDDKWKKRAFVAFSFFPNQT